MGKKCAAPALATGTTSDSGLAHCHVTMRAQAHPRFRGTMACHHQGQWSQPLLGDGVVIICKLPTCESALFTWRKSKPRYANHSVEASSHAAAKSIRPAIDSAAAPTYPGFTNGGELQPRSDQKS